MALAHKEVQQPVKAAYLFQEPVSLDEVLQQLIITAHDQDLGCFAHCGHDAAPGGVNSPELAAFVGHLLKDVFTAKDGLQVQPSLKCVGVSDAKPHTSAVIN